MIVFYAKTGGQNPSSESPACLFNSNERRENGDIKKKS